MHREFRFPPISLVFFITARTASTRILGGTTTPRKLRASRPKKKNRTRLRADHRATTITATMRALLAALLVLAIAVTARAQQTRRGLLDQSDAILTLQRSTHHCGRRTQEALLQMAAMAILRPGQRVSLLELVQNDEVKDALLEMDLACVAKTYAFREVMRDVITPLVVAPGLEGILDAQNASSLLIQFYDLGCSTGQLLGVAPKLAREISQLRRDGQYVQESQLLYQFYQIKYEYGAEEVGFTQRTADGHQAVSVCLAGDPMKSILSARECQDEYGGRKCHRGPRSQDPLTLPYSALYVPRKKPARAEEAEEGRSSSSRRRSGSSSSSRRYDSTYLERTLNSNFFQLP